jgi:hypothetical protein
MKNYLFILFLINSLINYSQNPANVTVGLEYSDNLRWKNYGAAANLELPVNDKFALNYRFVIGGSTDGAMHIHSAAGGAVGSVILSAFSNSGNKFINGLGVLLFLIPEGVTYYVNSSDIHALGIYCSPLGMDYWKKIDTYEYFRFSGESGVKVKIKVGPDNKYHLVAYAGLRYIYNRQDIVEPLFLHTGLGLSINLKK